MCIRIVTDSTSDLSEEVIKKYGITVIPVYINLGAHSFRDGVDLDRQEFYTDLEKGHAVPTTSSPSVDTFIQTYKDLTSKGAEVILSIHLSSSLSGLFNIASLAGRTIKQGIVNPFDAGQLSIGTGFIVETAAKLVQAGKSVNEIVEKIRDIANRTYCFAILDNLNYLKRSGRVSQLKSTLGSILQVKPILRFHQGVPTIKMVRTKQSAMNHLVGAIRSLGSLEQLRILHINAPEKAEELKHAAQEFFPESSIEIPLEVNPAIATHLGPGAVGFAAVAASLIK
jgi:DegV family protein with EDD domain